MDVGPVVAGHVTDEEGGVAQGQVGGDRSEHLAGRYHPGGQHPHGGGPGCKQDGKHEVSKTGIHKVSKTRRETQGY